MSKQERKSHQQYTAVYNAPWADPNLATQALIAGARGEVAQQAAAFVVRGTREHGRGAEARRSLQARRPEDYQLISSSAIQLHQANLGNLLQSSRIPVEDTANPGAQTPVLRT